MMNGLRKTVTVMFSLFFALCFAVAGAEMPTDGVEQGLEEIQPLIDMSEVHDTEGMSLEEITDAVTETAMSEYMDSATGFRMQYPSIFQFDEGNAGSFATTSDRKASLSIDNMNNQGGLDENALIEAIRFENPDAVLERNEQNGCIRFDRVTDDGSIGQSDLYFLTKHSFHHITVRYPETEKDIYFSYIEYMINTMETEETELG